MNERRYDSVGPVDPSAVIKGFDLSSARPRHFVKHGHPGGGREGGGEESGGGRSEQDGAAQHPPVVRLILYLFPRSRCNIHRAEIDLELDLLLDLLLDLSRVAGLLSRVSDEVPGKRNYFFKYPREPA